MDFINTVLFYLAKIDWFDKFLDFILIPLGLSLYFLIKKWVTSIRPQRRLLEGIMNQSEPLKIFVRDLYLTEGSTLVDYDPIHGTTIAPNINKVYPEVEGRAISNIYNVLGQVGKTQNIELIGINEDDRGEWNSQIILFGAQSVKHLNFYDLMDYVAYRMDDKEICYVEDGSVIIREDGFGYGIILKAHNPYRTGKQRGIAFLIGGFGTYGTEAASYYFKEHFIELGKEFGKNPFGIVIRASVSAGAEAAERLHKYDVKFILWKEKLGGIFHKKLRSGKELSAAASQFSGNKYEHVKLINGSNVIQPSGEKRSIKGVNKGSSTTSPKVSVCQSLNAEENVIPPYVVGGTAPIEPKEDYPSSMTIRFLNADDEMNDDTRSKDKSESEKTEDKKT